MGITLHLPQELEHKLREQAKHEGLSVDSYILHALESQVNKSDPLLSQHQAEDDELVRQITSKKLSSEFWDEYRALSEIADQEKLSKREYKRLIKLNNHKEETNAEIIQLCAQLAKLRDASLRSVMEELGIQPV